MSDNRVCEICNKRFSNGKAMGGHMRSHYAKFPLPSKLKSSGSGSGSAPPSPDRAKSDQHSCRAENSCRSANRRPTAVTNYRERWSDDTEPKLRHKPLTKMPEHGETAYCLSDREVALILMRISNSTHIEAADNRDKLVEEEEEEGGDDDYSDEEDDDQTFCVNRARSQGEYRCETCSKCFPSYQALGGHRASHTNSSYAMAGVNRKTFRCPYCNRMFDSGQALGGHKKVHHLPNNSGHAYNDSVSVLTYNKSPIDLNLPAERPEEEDEVLSKSELSSETDDDDEEMVPRPISRRAVQFQ